jgi:hypothetical protein
MEATPTKGNKMKLQATILMNDTIFGRDGKAAQAAPSQHAAMPSKISQRKIGAMTNSYAQELLNMM